MIAVKDELYSSFAHWLPKREEEQEDKPDSGCYHCPGTVCICDRAYDTWKDEQ